MADKTDEVKNEEEATQKDTTEALLVEDRLFRPLPQLVVDANLNPNDYEQAVSKGRHDLEGF